ncbi:MAG: TSUP family transporter [Alphaproteobacteria bacterium]|nr:TSUP family transporter [Alphaproteobacteria bacterium]
MDFAALLDVNSLILAFTGFIIGILGVVIGGAMFFAVPLMQWLFPLASFGIVVGNIKMGSFFRSIGSTISTHKHIEYVDNFKLSLAAFLGTILGASAIAQLDQAWLLPAVVLAIILALLAPKLAHKITNRTFHLASLLTGIYAGLFGAGIGVLLIALLRLKHPSDEKIAHVKIQARFVEWLLVITAIVTHFLHGNLVTSIWVPWSIGGLIGGYTGGVMLDKMGKLSGKVQKIILYVAFAFAFIVAAFKAFDIALS